jgi:hypothetical protein
MKKLNSSHNLNEAKRALAISLGCSHRIGAPRIFGFRRGVTNDFTSTIAPKQGSGEEQATSSS